MQLTTNIQTSHIEKWFNWVILMIGPCLKQQYAVVEYYQAHGKKELFIEYYQAILSAVDIYKLCGQLQD